MGDAFGILQIVSILTRFLSRGARAAVVVNASGVLHRAMASMQCRPLRNAPARTRLRMQKVKG